MQSIETITDTSGHHRLTENWDEATSALIGHALPVVRVEINEEGQATIIWRNEPTQGDKDKAISHIRGGVPVSHAW